MRISGGPFWIEIPADLLERVLAAAAREAPPELRREYEQDRDAVESIETVDIREASVRNLDAHWVERFGALDPLRTALIEERKLGETVSGCVLFYTRYPGKEGMLLEPEGLPAGGVLSLRLSPETLLSLPRLRQLLSGGRAR